MHAAAIQLLKQLSGAVRPQLRPSPRGARPVRLLGQNGGRWGRGEGVPLHPESPTVRLVKFPAILASAFWLQQIWTGGLDTAGMPIADSGGGRIILGERRK